MLSHKKGFTLIELIITMLIIAILAVVAIVAIRVKSMDARDARRYSDMKAISLAMSLSCVGGETFEITGNESVLPMICQLGQTPYLNFTQLFDPKLSSGCSVSMDGCSLNDTSLCEYAFANVDTGLEFAVAPQVIDPCNYHINFYEEAADVLSYITASTFNFTNNGNGEDDSSCVVLGNALDDGSTVIQASGITFGNTVKIKDKTKGNAKDNGWAQSRNGGQVWTEFGWPQPKLLNKMRVWSHFANGAEAIKDFSIIASNDRITWVTLYTGTHPGESYNEFVDYFFNNEIAYSYYRLLITSNYSGDGGDEVGLDEVEFLCQN
jgi:prepilin-type N-terminal cleavage/methylation domain-containing protein